MNDQLDDRRLKARIDALDRYLANIESRLDDAGLGRSHAVVDTLAEHERRIAALEADR